MKHTSNRIIGDLFRGFSLIEVLVFVTILGFVFIAAAAVGIVSIRDSQNSENRIVATRYGEELRDWLSSQKEADWLIFVEKSSPLPGTIYCFYTEPVNSWPSGSGNCVGNQLINSLFVREAILTYDSSLQRVNVDIHVGWNEGGNNYDVPINGVFTSLE